MMKPSNSQGTASFHRHHFFLCGALCSANDPYIPCGAHALAEAARIYVAVKISFLQLFGGENPISKILKFYFF